MTATASASTPSSLGGRASWRRPDIQGLRAIAVLSVIAFHADLPIPGGFTGVDIFFVISGYVITELILREHTSGRFSFARFYAKRAQRLLPALALMILAVFIASLLFQSPFGAQTTTAQTGIGAMLLVANIVITRTIGDYFAPTAEANPLLHTWSLSVEEQFYLVFPALLIIGLAWSVRRSTAKWLPFALVLALTLVSFLMGLSWTFGFTPFNVTSQPEAWAFYLSPARAWEFGAGALLALAVTRHKLAISRKGALPLALLGALLLVIGFWGITAETIFPGLAALLPVLGTVLLIAGGVRRNAISTALSTAPIVRIGDWSYSLYLWHWPFIVFALLLWPTAPYVATIAAIASFMPALVSYHVLENPIRRQTISPRNVARLTVVTILAVTLLGIGLWVFGPKLIPGIGDLNQDRSVIPAVTARGCLIMDAYEGKEAQDCWFRIPDAQGWVLLAGDSHAAASSDGVISAAHQLGLNVLSVTGGSCPFSALPVERPGLRNCDQLNADLWQLVESDDAPSVLVLAEKSTPTNFEATLRRLKGLGIPVVWLRDVPRWVPLENGMQNVPCSGGVVNFDCGISESDAVAFQNGNRAREQTLIDANPWLISVDPWQLFCTGEACSPMLGEKLAYFDNEHLNGTGAAALTDLVRSALSRALERFGDVAPSR